MNHNPTEFTQDLPALIDLARDYRKELLQNPEKAKGSSNLIMGMCITNFGHFSHLVKEQTMPSESDYILHLSFCLLRECCLHERIPAIIPRMLLNNIAIKVCTEELEFVVPRHQQWALEIFDCIRSDLVPDFITKLKIQHLITPQILLEITQKQFSQNRFNDASLMIVRYKFHAHFDIYDLMLKLVDTHKLETAKLLIQHDDELKVKLIKVLCTNENVKKAEGLIKDFKLNIDDFPEVKERIMKNSMRYFLGRNLYKNKNQQEFLTLDRVEDLLVGIKQMLGYLVEDLCAKGKKQEAKGIMLRNHVEAYVRQDVLEMLRDVQYQEDKDTSLQKHDAFEPLSQPQSEYIKLPASVQVTWIGTDDDVPQLEVLLKDEFIGVDSEWRP